MHNFRGTRKKRERKKEKKKGGEDFSKMLICKFVRERRRGKVGKTTIVVLVRNSRRIIEVIDFFIVLIPASFCERYKQHRQVK